MEVNELSLFTGIGGGLLGTKLLGWRCIGAVDNDEYCCKVLDQRIKDGCFEPFDIFCMDIREFNRGVAPIYRDKVDVLSAGFPCQPFSVAGKRLGDQDERNMWPATIKCIRLVRPRYLLLENVPGLLTHKYVRRIYGDLAESGYNPQWDCVSAGIVGFPSVRNRLWIADTQSSFGGWKRFRPLPAGTWSKQQFERLVQDTLRSELSTHTSCGISDRVANRMDRLRCTGQIQVPAVVAAVWRLLK